jgi:K+-sensing histidine kinase KdpD
MDSSNQKIIEQIIKNLSHEIKNPLATIKGYAQLLSMRPNNPEMLEKSQRMIIEQIDRIDLLLKNLYDIFSTSLEDPESFDAIPKIDEMIAVFEYDINAKLTKTISLESALITGKKIFFEKIIILIIKNFDWKNNPQVTCEIILDKKNNQNILEIRFKSISFKDFDKDLFYLPFSFKKCYLKGTELYEVYSICNKCNWTLELMNQNDLNGFRIKF